ncbi:hypothetical protein [Peribacillus frigoritolerans]
MKAFKSNKSKSPHKLRHTYGTNLLEQSGDSSTDDST